LFKVLFMQTSERSKLSGHNHLDTIMGVRMPRTGKVVLVQKLVIGQRANFVLLDVIELHGCCGVRLVSSSK
jgi:hypothetical protein